MTLAREMHMKALANTCETRLQLYKKLLNIIDQNAKLGQFGVVWSEVDISDAIAMMSMARSDGFHAQWLGNSIVISW